MTRSLVRMVAVACVVSVLVLAGSSTRAMAHPLGNFTINHHVGLHLTEDTLILDYVVDMAEIPAFTEIRAMGDPADTEALDRYSSRACTELAPGLRLTLDGEVLELDVLSAAASTPPGNSGVPTLRIECTYETDISAGTLLVENANHTERIGWREMVASSEVPISTDLPSESPSYRLTAYPDDGLSSVPDVRDAEIVIGRGATAAPTGSASGAVAALGSVVQIESLGLGTGVAAIAAALALGIGHALAPGHGKTVVAAYLVGSRGNARQAMVLALATAFSHTIGVAVLGVITATASVTFEPAVIYPYLSSIAGLVVLAIGIRLLWRLHQDRSHGHDHHDDHHSDHTPALSWRTVATLGLSGGLVPSASAVVLLLGAVHIGHAWFGVLLVTAFGVGMSVALVGSGLLAVFAQRWGWRLFARNRSHSPLRRWIPRVAAGAVVALGTIMTVTAFASISLIG